MGRCPMTNDELATTSQDCQGDLTLGTLGCVELFVTLGFATKSQRICEVCEGLPAWFNARTLSLVPSRNSDAREILLRSLSPDYADGTLTHILNITAQIRHIRGRVCEAESSFPSASARAHILVQGEQICKTLRSCANAKVRRRRCWGEAKGAQALIHHSSFG